MADLWQEKDRYYLWKLDSNVLDLPYGIIDRRDCMSIGIEDNELRALVIQRMIAEGCGIETTPPTTRNDDVTISGWKVGLKTISLLDLLRRYTGMGLAHAKQSVDGLLDGRPIVIAGIHPAIASHIRKEVESLGGVCTISQGQPLPAGRRPDQK